MAGPADQPFGTRFAPGRSGSITQESRMHLPLGLAVLALTASYAVLLLIAHFSFRNRPVPATHTTSPDG
jgi:hypothetical protein